MGVQHAFRKKSISLDTLSFVKPFSHLCKGPGRYTGKPVLIEGFSKRPGVLITRFRNTNGVVSYQVKFHSFSVAQSASRIYQLLLKKGITEIEFCPIACSTKQAALFITRIQKQLRTQPLDTHLEKVRNWFRDPQAENFPFEQLHFRRPFLDFGTFKKTSFIDYSRTSGVYLIREYRVLENSFVTVYVGKSTSVLGSRIRNKFYSNPHLFYKDIEGELEYHIFAIEISPLTVSRREDHIKLLEQYESVLIKVLRPRDNKLGNPDYFIPESKWIPIDDGEEMPF